MIEIETIEDYGEKIHETEESIPTETSQFLTVFNKTIHHEDDSSDEKSVIEIKSPQENGEQEIGKQSNPADILSKHWEFATVWPLLKPILFWRGETATQLKGSDRIPSTTPGAEPPRDARDSGSARSHSTHLETSSSNRPSKVTYMELHTVPSYMPVKCTRRTLRMPSFTRATHAQPSLSNFTRRDSEFVERARSRGTTRLERKFPTSPKIKKTKLSHCSIYVPMRTISTRHTK